MDDICPRNLTLPGNSRYQPKSLQPIWGYDNLYRGVGLVEIANLLVLSEIGVIPESEAFLLTPEIISKILDIRTSDVDKTEREVTKHDILAWKHHAQLVMPKSLHKWVHILLTSYDPISTGQVLQFVKAHNDVIRPHIKSVVKDLAEKVDLYADTLQLGRTHGQAALPITVGFWLATILSRVLYNANKMEEHVGQLVGKISGAVGTSSAIVGLGILKKCGNIPYEDRVLAKLGLKAAPISTQIVPPEPVAYYLFSMLMLQAAFGQLGRDCRCLVRTGIDEVREQAGQGQGVSSTMAHKDANPINFENLEGTCLRTMSEFFKVLLTLISEHQRDLVGSSIMRDFPIIVVNLELQLGTLLRDKDGTTFIQRISIDEERCRINFDAKSNLILAEPLYIALQMAGYPGDAHGLVNRKVVPLAKTSGRHLIEELTDMDDDNIQAALANIPEGILEALHHPEQYTGLAEKKARETVQRANDFIRTLPA